MTNSLTSQIKGEILTIRATIANLKQLEAKKHKQLEKELVKANLSAHQFQKSRPISPILLQHFQWSYDFWGK